MKRPATSQRQRSTSAEDGRSQRLKIAAHLSMDDAVHGTIPPYYALSAYQNAPPPYHLPVFGDQYPYGQIPIAQTMPSSALLSEPGVPPNMHSAPVSNPIEESFAPLYHPGFATGERWPPSCSSQEHVQEYIHRTHPMAGPPISQGHQSFMVNNMPEDHNIPPPIPFKPVIPFNWIKNGVPGVTRVRTTHACESCRQRKTKCSGEQPTCARCDKHSVECIYDHRVRSRAKQHSYRLATPPPAGTSFFEDPPAFGLHSFQDSNSGSWSSEEDMMQFGNQSFPMGFSSGPQQPPLLMPDPQSSHILFPEGPQTGTNDYPFPHSGPMIVPRSLVQQDLPVPAADNQLPVEISPFLRHSPSSAHQSFGHSYPDQYCVPPADAYSQHEYHPVVHSEPRYSVVTTPIHARTLSQYIPEAPPPTANAATSIAEVRQAPLRPTVLAPPAIQVVSQYVPDEQALLARYTLPRDYGRQVHDANCPSEHVALLAQHAQDPAQRSSHIPVHHQPARAMQREARVYRGPLTPADDDSSRQQEKSQTIMGAGYHPSCFIQKRPNLAPQRPPFTSFSSTTLYGSRSSSSRASASRSSVSSTASNQTRSSVDDFKDSSSRTSHGNGDSSITREEVPERASSSSSEAQVTQRPVKGTGFLCLHLGSADHIRPPAMIQRSPDALHLLAASSETRDRVPTANSFANNGVSHASHVQGA